MNTTTIMLKVIGDIENIPLLTIVKYEPYKPKLRVSSQYPEGHRSHKLGFGHTLDDNWFAIMVKEFVEEDMHKDLFMRI